MGKKEKKDKSLNESKIADENGDEISYEDRLQNVSVIATPMASKKLAKKVWNANQTLFIFSVFFNLFLF